MAKTLTIDVTFAGQSFAFQLWQRELDFGPAGRAPYYWMDGRQFRSKTPGPNYRACVDLWWTAVQDAGAAHEDDNQVNLVLAECYPLVSAARSLQDVYVDAHLHTMADRQFAITKEHGRWQGLTERTYSLPREEVTRLKDLAASRDSHRIRAELEGLFLGEMPPHEELPAYQEAARAWVGNGMVALRRGGRTALRSYVGEVGNWIQKYRKQGNQDRERRFVNMFGYECKVAFYLCHTSAWVGLVQRLAAEGRINVTGQRFLRTWHHQNQPTDDEDGKVPGHARDVFCGQVLSLHPLSGIVLNDPFCLATIGRWLAHPEYDALHQANRVADCADYWNMVATILVAAHEYKHARDAWEATRRNVTYTSTDTTSRAARDDAVASLALFFEDYAAERRLVCPECNQKLAYSSHVSGKESDNLVRVVYRCPSGHSHSVNVSEEETLQRPEDD